MVLPVFKNRPETLHFHYISPKGIETTYYHFLGILHAFGCNIHEEEKWLSYATCPARFYLDQNFCIAHFTWERLEGTSEYHIYVQCTLQEAADDEF